MENLDKFLKTYLKVEEYTEEDIKKAEEEYQKRLNENLKNKIKSPSSWGDNGLWELEWRIRNMKAKIGANKYRHQTHANVAKNLARNLFDDNIVAYTKDRFMAMVIIRGKKNFFAFVVKSNDLYLGGFQYSLMDLSLKEAVEKIEFLLKDFPEGTKIDKPQLWQELKNTILVDALQES